MPDPVIAAFRFGFGLPLPDAAPTSPQTMLAALSGPDSQLLAHPGPTTAQIFPLMAAATAAQKARRQAPPDQQPAATAAYRAALAPINALALGAAKGAFARALDAPDGFRERLALFWADHFTTRARARDQAALPAALMDEAIRPHLTGRFADLLSAAILHPAMLAYLDQGASMGPNSRAGQRRGRGLNENLARELLELHTLGVGAGYDQTDVRELAKALTGLIIGPAGQDFSAARAEPGAEVVLGTRYDGPALAPIRAVLHDLAVHPQTARHIAQKLAVHFVSDSPDADLVAALEQAFLTTQGDLMAVYGALLHHPAAWRPQAAKVRQPFEFMVAALRALGVSGLDVMQMTDRHFRRRLHNPLRAMGQPWQQAPGPDGWPEAPDRWITPPHLAARILWAMQAATIWNHTPDPQALLTRALGPRASPALVWAVPRAETTAQARGLVLASAEFNRR
ncbi:DUF1800 domain-containing protein [Pseudotabrizicola sp. L79]|uniref:DUF1800 domain-containing protein n=1 Tax=Pseudotabrizicola sp. L79 TaxID=3118402 RepID=UPI002F9326CC